MTSDILKRAAEAQTESKAYFEANGIVVTDPGLVPELIVENARLTARAEAAEAMVDRDADLLLDAYKALLVLHRMLDKHGLTAGVEAANSLANRIVAAHPEMPGRAAMKEGQ